MGLFFIFKFIVFTASFFRASSAAVLGHRAPCPGTVSWSLPGQHEEQLAQALPSLTAHQDTPAANIPCFQAFLLPLHWPHSGQEEARAHESSSLLRRNPNPTAPSPPRLGQEPPHSWIHPCLAGLGGCSLETCFPEKQEKLTKAGVGN